MKGKINNKLDYLKKFDKIFLVIEKKENKKNEMKLNYEDLNKNDDKKYKKEKHHDIDYFLEYLLEKYAS